jgi:hypothetical protein
MLLTVLFSNRTAHQIESGPDMRAGLHIGIAARARDL